MYATAQLGDTPIWGKPLGHLERSNRLDQQTIRTGNFSTHFNILAVVRLDAAWRCVDALIENQRPPAPILLCQHKSPL